MALHLRRPHRSRLKRVVATLIAAFLGVLLSFTLTDRATATPSPSDVEQQIDAQWNQLEPAIEADNAAKISLAANQKKAQQLADALKPLQEQVDKAFGTIANISVRYYINGRQSTLNALLTTGNPATFADELTMLDALTSNEQIQMKSVLDLEAKYEAQKKPLDALVAQLTTQETQLAAKAKQIQDQIDQLNKERLAAYGTTQGTGALRPVPCPFNYDGSKGARAARFACSQIGKPYVWATAGPRTYDCSGLMLWAWGQVGVTLEHYTKWQYDETKRVSKADLQPGDLVFFYSDLHHVGMYVGNGWMVNAPHSGDVVRMAQLAGMPVSAYGRPG